MNEDQLQKLRISSEQKRRSSTPVWLIILIVLGITGVVAFFAVPRASDSIRAGLKSGSDSAKSKPAGFTTNAAGSSAGAAKTGSSASGFATQSSAAASSSGDSLLTVSGYIIARERIELSPRFMGVVTWIGVKKGDVVTNGQTVVLLDDSEYRARLAESDGQIAVAKVALEKATTDLRRATELVAQRVEMNKTLDDAKLAVASSEAQLQQILGARKLIETWMEWCVIRSPVNGVVLEKLVDANELVSPQTFGGARGPSASLIALAGRAPRSSRSRTSAISRSRSMSTNPTSPRSPSASHAASARKPTRPKSTTAWSRRSLPKRIAPRARSRSRCRSRTPTASSPPS